MAGKVERGSTSRLLGLLALALGIISLVFVWQVYVVLPCAILAVFLAKTVRSRAEDGSRPAWLGMVFGLLAIFLWAGLVMRTPRLNDEPADLNEQIQQDAIEQMRQEHDP